MPATLTTDEVMCPKCGGRTWDNRATKTNPKAPDYKCRDRACDGVVWPPKGGPARPAAASAAKAPYSSGAPIAGIDAPEGLDRLFALYDVCYAHAMETVSKTFANDEPSQVAVTAATATLFIAAKERGLGT
jgi:hypothetical protein